MALLTAEIDAMLDASGECALWSSTDDIGAPLDRGYSREDIDRHTLAMMRRDVVAFLSANEEEIDGLIDRAGHDLWLTRNRHGAGFWDGDWPEPAATRLTESAHKMGEFELYIGDDGRIHGFND